MANLTGMPGFETFLVDIRPIYKFHLFDLAQWDYRKFHFPIPNIQNTRYNETNIGVIPYAATPSEDGQAARMVVSLGYSTSQSPSDYWSHLAEYRIESGGAAAMIHESTVPYTGVNESLSMYLVTSLAYANGGEIYLAAERHSYEDTIREPPTKFGTTLLHWRNRAYADIKPVLDWPEGEGGHLLAADFDADGGNELLLRHGNKLRVLAFENGGITERLERSPARAV